MRNKESDNRPTEISLTLRYIIKSTAFMAHHKHLRPGNFNFQIPMIDYTIPNDFWVFAHQIIGIALFALWIEINIRVVIKIAQRLVQWGHQVVHWIQTKRSK